MVWWTNSVILFKVMFSFNWSEVVKMTFPSMRTVRDDALVLSSELGDRQVLTADTVITGESVLQFEVGIFYLVKIHRGIFDKCTILIS